MRDAGPTSFHQLPPTGGCRESRADHASLQEKMRRGEIGGQALGLVQLVAAQGACSNATGDEPSHRPLAGLN